MPHLTPQAVRFQSTLSVRRATSCGISSSSDGRFQSTLSVRRATRLPNGHGLGVDISIHALRKESDLPLVGSVRSHSVFQSTLSVRRATGTKTSASLFRCISIHALRKESDEAVSLLALEMVISIHALRKESDP